MRKKFNYFLFVKLLFGAILFINYSWLYAWDGHFLFTYAAVKNMPEISHDPTIPTETLAMFLAKEKMGVAKLLEENETWSRSNIFHYPPLPAALKFTVANPTKPIVSQFLEAIRVNPLLTFPLFVQHPPQVQPYQFVPMKYEQIMLPMVVSAVTKTMEPVEKVPLGKKISALDIIATASAEPDYGLDINLWEDNPSSFSKIYGWGKQPFGNKTIVLSSQAPFHMGFFYENPLIYKFAPEYQISYLEYRIHLYLNLAHYAFKTGHDYWGYRFLGWALHYIEDLTQPYHTAMAPGISIFQVFYSISLEKIGYEATAQNLTQLILNRHYSLENYVYFLMQDLIKNNANNHPLLIAITDVKHDANYPSYSDSYPRNIIAKESFEEKNRINTALVDALPKKYVLDPYYIFLRTEPDVNVYASVKQHQTSEMTKLNEEVALLFRNFGSHVRNVIRYTLGLKKSEVQ